MQSTFRNFRKYPRKITVDFLIVGAGGGGSYADPYTSLSGGGNGGNGGNGGSVSSFTTTFWSIADNWINVTVGAPGGSGGYVSGGYYSGQTGVSSSIAAQGTAFTLIPATPTGISATADGGAGKGGYGGGSLVTIGAYNARNGSAGSGGTYSYVDQFSHAQGGAGGPAFSQGNAGANGAANTGNGGRGGQGGGNTWGGGPGGNGGSGFVTIRCKISDISSYSATGLGSVTSITISNVAYNLYKFNSSGSIQFNATY